MQPKSIHTPAPIENAQTQKPFPTSGDNFTTITRLDDVIDPMALLEAIGFLDDYTVAMAAFEAELERTGTLETQ
ncbi:MAG: hypothetical protein CSA11_12080 [Chloroflexi bacterium]|nr:MAG: hypothetical protein CSA11_12080 [Chloroflexota bacterium]